MNSFDPSITMIKHFFKSDSITTTNRKSSEPLTVEVLEDRMMLSTVQIYAAGTTGTESLELKINDVVTATFENVGGDAASRDFQQLLFTTDQNVTADDIRLEFINDLYRPEDGFDRDIVIDRIVVDGNTYETESSSTYSTGVWRDGGVSDPGFLETETLNINGSFFYFNGGISDPPTQTGTILRIEAEGTTGEEQLQVRVDGEVVESFDVSTTLDSYFYITNENVSVDRIQLEFANDLYNPEAGIDRNLVVEQIQLVDRATLERQRFFTAADSTFSTGTWQASDGVADGFGRGDTLHSNGYFRYGQGIFTDSLAIDTSYGNNGFAANPSVSFSSLIGVSSTGKVASVIGAGDPFNGTATTDLLLFDESGNILNQTTIGGGGRQQPRIFGIEFGADDSIFISLDAPRALFSYVVKLTPNGNLDTAFGSDGNGRLTLENVYPAKLAIASNGALLSAGQVVNSGQLTVTKYDPQGNIVNSFGNSGTTLLNFGTVVEGIEATSDGGAYVIVNDGQTGSRTITRLNANGQPVSTYGFNGSVFLPPQEFGGTRNAIVDSQDRLILSSLFFADRNDILRITADGQIDSGFGDGGTVTLDPDFQGLELDSQDRIVGSSNIVLEEGTTAGVFRLNEDGGLDPTFDDDGIFETALGLDRFDNNQLITNVQIANDGTFFAKSGTGVRKYDIV